MKECLRQFGYLWLCGICIIFVLLFANLFISILLQGLAFAIDKLGSLFDTGKAFKVFSAIAYFSLGPFLFAWFLRLVIRKPDGLTRMILSEWMQEGKSR